jgi:hypothetical protein
MILSNGAVQAFGKRDELLPLISNGKALNGSKQTPIDDGPVMDN